MGLSMNVFTSATILANAQGDLTCTFLYIPS